MISVSCNCVMDNVHTKRTAKKCQTGIDIYSVPYYVHLNLYGVSSVAVITTLSAS